MRAQSGRHCSAWTPSFTWRRRWAWEPGSGTWTTTWPAMTWAPRCCCGRWVRPEPRRLVLASSMVVYGEGVRCPAHGPVARRPRARRTAAGDFEPRCPACGVQLAPDLVGEDARLDPRSGYAATKVAQEQLAAVWARETGGGGHRAALSQRVRPGHSRGHALRRGRGMFRSASARGAGAPGVRRRRAAPRLRACPRRCAAVTRAAARAEPGRLRAYNVGAAGSARCGELATALAHARRSPPVVTGAYRLGDVRHITASSRADRGRAGLGRGDGLRGGDGRAGRGIRAALVGPGASGRNSQPPAMLRTLSSPPCERTMPSRSPARARHPPPGVRAGLPRQPVSKTRSQISGGDAAARGRGPPRTTDSAAPAGHRDDTDRPGPYAGWRWSRGSPARGRARRRRPGPAAAAGAGRGRCARLAADRRPDRRPPRRGGRDRLAGPRGGPGLDPDSSKRSSTRSESRSTSAGSASG